MGDRRLFRRGSAPSGDQPAVEAVNDEPLAPLEAEGIEDENCARSPLTVEGVISGVALGSRGDAPALEVSIDAGPVEDEGEPLILVWLGRTEIAGIHPGRAIVATARVCSEGGARVMYNPRYDLR